MKQHIPIPNDALHFALVTAAKLFDEADGGKLNTIGENVFDILRLSNAIYRETGKQLKDDVLQFFIMGRSDVIKLSGDGVCHNGRVNGVYRVVV